MKIIPSGRIAILAGALALCPALVYAQGVVEYGTATSAAGTLGAKIGSALGSAVGGMNKQSSETLLKAPLNPPPSAPQARPKATKQASTGKTGNNRSQIKKLGLTGPNAVRLDSTPSGAAIFIDGVAAGSTPANLTLSKGIHTIELRHDGYTTWRKNVLLTEGETLSYTPALQDPKTSRPRFTVQR